MDGLKLQPPPSIMLSDEFFTRGHKFSKLMKLANILEIVKVEACYDLIAYINSLPSGLENDLYFVAWATELPQTKLSKTLTRTLLLVVLALVKRKASNFSVFAFSQQLLTWIIRQPKALAESAGEVLARLWRWDNGSLEVVIGREAPLASVKVLDSFFKNILNFLALTECECNLIAKLFLAALGNVPWSAVTAASRFEDDMSFKEQAAIIKAILSANNQQNADVLLVLRYQMLSRRKMTRTKK